MKTMFAALFVTAPLATLTMPIAGGAVAAEIVPKYLPAPVYGISYIRTGGGINDVEMNYSRGLNVTYPTNRPLDVTSTNVARYDNTDFHVTTNVTASNDHLGTLSASVKTDHYQAGAYGALYYYFTLIGPSAKEVPVTISGYGSAEISSLHDFGSASATIRMNGLTGTTEDFNTGEHHEFSDTIEVDPSVGGAIELFAFVQQGTFVNPGFGGTDLDYYAGSASATVDPMIYIADPALAKLYTIEVGLSDMVLLPPAGSVSPVPLPGSLPLFALACLVASAASAIHRKAAAGT